LYCDKSVLENEIVCGRDTTVIFVEEGNIFGRLKLFLTASNAE
jgi:hypothetical protein